MHYFCGLLKYNMHPLCMIDYRHLSDIELAAAFRRQADNAIIGELYTRYRTDIFKYGLYCNYKYCQNTLNRELIEDFTADVFARLFKQLQQYEVNSNFKNWLMRSAHNLFMDMIKREAHYVHTDDDKEIEKNIGAVVENDNFDSLLSINDKPEPNTTEIIDLLNKQAIDINAFLAHCLENIGNKEQQICLYHFYFEQLTYKEISNLTGFDLKKVKTALQHGKRTLQNAVLKAVHQF